jgi:hypothetical protein
MQAVVVKQNVNDAVAVVMIEAIKMHGGEIHTHQGMDATSIFGL